MHKDEKSGFVHLTGDCRIIMWLWEKSKCFAMTSIPYHDHSVPNQISFCPTDHNIILATGKHTFKYFRIQETNTMKVVHHSINKKDATQSTNYTCHAWMPDGRIIVCNDFGDIFILENGGEFKFMLQEAPGSGFKIEKILLFSKGLVICGEFGQIQVFEKNEENKNPYTFVAKLPAPQGLVLYEDANIKRGGQFSPKLINQVMKAKICSMAINSLENTLVFTTDNNQIMKTAINIDRKCDESKYEFMIYPFHSSHINGVDVCMKKHLIATCSHDNSIRIWNYVTKTLEICETFMDEPMSVAFHPSGFHIVVGFVDRVRMMNIFSRNIKTYKEIPIKGCKEIKFSHGGNLFACANQFAINVFKFYSGECP